MNLLVTVTYNAMAGGVFESFLASVLAQDDPGLRLLIIDNASSDGTPDRLRAISDPRVTVRLNTANIGFASACNQGIAHARAIGAEFVTFINNDTEFDPTLLRRMRESLVASGADALTPLIVYHEQPDRVWFGTGSLRWARGLLPYHDHLGGPVSREPRGRQETDFAPACCLICPTALFERVAPFDERYFVYWEDADLCVRLQRIGAHVVTDFALVCRHKVSVSTGGATSEFSVFHYNRGHMIFLRNHYGWAAVLVALPILAAKATLRVLLRRADRRQLMTQWRGIRAGLKAA